jgi:hypothetical protein
MSDKEIEIIASTRREEREKRGKNEKNGKNVSQRYS